MTFNHYISSKNFLTAVLIYAGVLLIQYLKLDFVVIAIFVAILGLIIVKPQSGVFLTLTSLFIFDDLPFDLTNEHFTSLHTFSIAGQTLTKLLSIIFIFILTRNIVLRNKITIPPTIIKVLLLILCTGVLYGIINGHINNLKEFINDIRFFLNFLVGFYLVYSFLKETKKYYQLLGYMATIFAIKGFFLFILTIFLTKFGRLYTITSDTTFYMANFFILFFIINLRKENKKYHSTSIIGVVFTLLALGLSASRGKIALLGLSVLLFLFAMRKLKLLPLITASAVGLVYFIALINPDMFNYLMWKLTSFIPEKGRGESSFVRFVEYANIIGMNTESPQSFLLGQGFGGFFSTDYMFFPFEIEGTSSYPVEWIKNNTFYKPHGSLSVLLLKNGFGGVILLYSFLIRFFYKVQAKRKYLLSKSKNLGTIIIIYASCIIPSFLISYSSKLNLFGGVLFGICFCIYKDLKNEKSLSS